MLELYVVLTMAAIGYILNKSNGSQSAAIKVPVTSPHNEKPSMDNIYNSTFANETLRQTAQKAKAKYLQSMNPQVTGVISKNYGVLKEDTPKIRSLTGEYMTKEEFTHANMTPFFGGSIKQNMDFDTNDNVLLNHNGTDKFYKSKKEVNSFFEQCQDLTNVNGMGVKSDYYRERLVAPVKQNNVTPIPQVHVGPGINRGFTSEPTGGYQQFDVRDMIMPKNVDELRVANKPKTTFEGVTIEGQKSKVRGDLGQVNKNKPETFYEQTPEMWLKTTGAFTKPMHLPEQIVKDTNRQDTSLEYIGSAFGQTQQKRAKDPSVRTTRRPNLEKFGLANATLTKHGNKEKHDYGKASILVYENERDVTSTRVYQGNLTSLIKSIVAPFTDMIKVTKKEDMIDNPRHFGNMSAQFPEKATIYDPNDTARTTLKEQLIQDASIGNLRGPSKLTVHDPNDVARTTLKEQLIQDADVGNLRGPSKLTVHDPNDVARTTLKEQLIHDTAIGNLKGPTKNTICDTNDVARTTLKEQLIHDTNIANLKGPTQLSVYDPEDIARVTIRQSTNYEKTGNLKGRNKDTIYFSDKAKATLAETLIELNRTGNLERNQGGNAYDFVDWEARLTQKQFISDNDYYGGAKHDKGNGYETNEYEARPTQKAELSDNDFYGIATANNDKKSIDTSNIESMTIRDNKESVIQGRDPTFSGNKTYTTGDDVGDWTNRKVECDIKTYRETPNSQRVFNEIPSTEELNITKHRNDYSQNENDRLDISIIKSRLDNPFNMDISKGL